MSVIIGRALPTGGGGTAKQLDFTYTGQYNERPEDGVVELLSTGILTVSKKTVIDYFMVGGGASGNVGDYSSSDNTIGYGGGGGASGYTITVTAKILYPGVSYQVVIGSGGAAVSADSSTSRTKLGNAGGHTIAFGSKVEGGKTSSEAKNGGDGGSGGGGSVIGTSGVKTYTAGAGGSDGSDGETPEKTNNTYTGKGGTGQGTTTREFGEPNGKLYAGGGAAGGGASYSARMKSNGGAGGAGGGGAGGGRNNDGAGSNGEANTGGGGGGSAASLSTSSSNRVSGAGGSGIVCIRLHKEA